MPLLPPCPLLLIFPWTPPPRIERGKDFGFSAHIRGGEGLSCKVVDPITEIIVTRRDKTALIAVQVMEDYEGRPTAIKMRREVGWLDAVAQEEGSPPILRP